MTTTRRDLLTAALATAAGATVTTDLAHAQIWPMPKSMITSTTMIIRQLRRIQHCVSKRSNHFWWPKVWSIARRSTR
jgi:hypothetical protein